MRKTWFKVITWDSLNFRLLERRPDSVLEERASGLLNSAEGVGEEREARRRKTSELGLNITESFHSRSHRNSQSEKTTHECLSVLRTAKICFYLKLLCAVLFQSALISGPVWLRWKDKALSRTGFFMSWRNRTAVNRSESRRLSRMTMGHTDRMCPNPSNYHRKWLFQLFFTEK